MVKRCDKSDWKSQREQIIGLGDRSVRKNYYPQLKKNVERVERFRKLLDFSSDSVMLVKLPHGEICDVNKATQTLLHLSNEDIIGKTLRQIEGKSQNDIVQQMVPLLERVSFPEDNEKDVVTELSYRDGSKDHSVCWIELAIRKAKVEMDEYLIVVGRDITERKNNEEVLKVLLNEKEALLDNALIGMAWIRDRTIISCNKKLDEMLGFKHETAVGKSTRILYESDDTYSDFGVEAYRALALGEAFTGTIKLARVDGDSIWCQLTGNAIDPAHPQDGSVWIFNDVNEHMLTQEKAVFLSQHDSLTHLPNHRLFEDRLIQAIASADKNRPCVAVINLDIDRFKNVNDLLGYNGGNELLIEVAKRLETTIGDQATICRQGGDEFLFLVNRLHDAEACLPMLSQIFSTFNADFHINRQELSLTCSLGVSIYPQDGHDFATLLNNADIAMYKAKDSGRNSYQFFSADMNSVAEETLTIAFGLHKALEQHQFELHYQPQIDIASGKLIGAEALLRWKHPELGLIPPNKFIPVAEDTGMIISIGKWVIEEACREVKTWSDMGLAEPVVAVNLSAIQFTNDDIETTVRNAIVTSGIRPEMLELELTESIIIRDAENVLAKVKRLQLMGCKLSIDDFGTGYSSLAYLKRFAVDKLKIDQAFVRELHQNQDDAVIVRTIIQMANSLGLKTIAEGIETQEVLDLLKLYRCDEAQGYFIARPMPSEEFVMFMRKYLA
ncbi:EAL domain-containing protein [Vibrio viridaestus]|uniref:cyclic-guanylate-specific phosphodiesterase n=1 Tax=Vibrio viridaestus TaxID=2487322 RepID=A0A3N9TJR3_9VIBR|nr:EAL domain-containing protein [Vibrio viridaestus]RQW64569.1 EAL domain-containing protein [Vibrio viridaestus]